MYQIDNATAVPSKPASTAAGTPGYFTDGSAVGGVPATVVPAEWLNAVQTELINAITAAGITPSKALFNQLSSAIQTIPAGRVLNIQPFTTPGTCTYTPTAGTKSVQVVTLGGGGGGGGTGPSGSGLATAAGGGGAGSMGISNRISSSFSGVAVVVGAGGLGVLNANGSSGGASSFGAFVSAPGGSGAVAQNGVTPPGYGQFGGGGSMPTGTALMLGIPGWAGGNGAIYTTAAVLSGKGADSPFGSGGITLGTSATGVGVTGAAGSGYGSGGSGGCSTAGGANSRGGNAGGGLVLVYEYS